MSIKTVGYVCRAPGAKLEPWEFERRAVGDNDVLLDILHVGICHSDIHYALNEWGNSTYPLVPGHEIIGKVSQVGSKVTKFKVGDHAGIGCMVDSCRECESCKQHEENFCEKGFSETYNGTEMDRKTPTYGGYSRQIVVNQDFALTISSKFKDLRAVAPLLCAGITTYHPLNAHKDKVIGKSVAINGLGGLGHVAVKIAAAMGAKKVTVISTSPAKESDAKKLGATDFLVSKDADAMKKAAGTFDLILDTVSAQHDISILLGSLRNKGVLATVGAPPKPLELPTSKLIFGNKAIYGSLIGGIAETQEMLDFCAEHGVLSEIEYIGIDRVQEAYERTLKADVRYRFVIDASTIKK